MKQDLALLLLRIGSGGMIFFGHGLPKILSFSDKVDSFPDPLGLGATVSLLLAVLAEGLCSLALAAGFYTRYAAIPLLVTMLVAAGIVHADDPWSNKEMALLYALPFAALLLAGGGRFSVDKIRFDKAD